VILLVEGLVEKIVYSSMLEKLYSGKRVGKEHEDLRNMTRQLLKRRELLEVLKQLNLHSGC